MKHDLNITTSIHEDRRSFYNQSEFTVSIDNMRLDKLPALLCILNSLVNHINAQALCSLNLEFCLFTSIRPGDNRAEFHLRTYTKTGWVAFGLGSDMASAEIFVA